MPVIKSAKKKLRKDQRREKKNDRVRESLKKTIKAARKNPSDKIISQAFQAIDKASKNSLLHKNKAARIKSALSKLVGSKPSSTTPKTASKAISKKKAKKTSKKTSK